MNESKHKKKHKVVQSITYAPPTLDVWTKEQLFAKDCVASVYTKDIAGMTIPQLKDYIQKAVEHIELNPQFVYSRHHIGNLVSHRAVAKEMKKVAMSSIPYILNNGHPVTKWEFKPDPQNPIDRMQSCLYGAPIMINDNKYLCLLTVKFNNLTGKIFPYVVNIEDGKGMKVSDDISVLDNNDATTPSNSGTSTGTVTSQDSRAPSNPSVKVQQNIETTKDNNIKTENYTYMNKKQIRLTESDLHRIIRGSVNKILSEEYSTPPLKDRISYANYANVDDYNGDINDKEDFNSMAGTLNKVYSRLIDIKEVLPDRSWFETVGDYNNGSEKYFDYLIKCIDGALNCINRIVKINMMNRGLQPRIYGRTDSSPIGNNDRTDVNPYYKRGRYNRIPRYKSVDIDNPENPKMNY